MFGEGYSHWVGGLGRGGRHGRGDRSCGPRSGGFRKGPFEISWSVDGSEERGRGRRRMFDAGELRLVLLKLLADEPRHGYDLIRAIEERTGGAYAPSPGVVYPTLTLLADMALAQEQDGGGQRRLFAVTETGTVLLAEKADEVAGLFARLDSLAEYRARTDGGPVRRAIHNLRQVLQHKLGDEETDRERLHAIVALIDEAAGKIERL